ncbi:hypothetical protein L2E82_14091 [Cichorium intybus]|uniref:Uncharacterized protein n=1 Tax=Cichorium intybus TaxID=13427 RepID=A0ACB9EZL9_CICIN|nr:hypothetical protein L2E82_14091 [Cichorium intybus]
MFENAGEVSPAILFLARQDIDEWLLGLENGSEGATDEACISVDEPPGQSASQLFSLPHFPTIWFPEIFLFSESECFLKSDLHRCSSLEMPLNLSVVSDEKEGN